MQLLQPMPKYIPFKGGGELATQVVAGAVDGGVVGLKGNLAPDGAIVKIAGLKKLQFSGKARCFDNEEDASISSCSKSICRSL